MEATSLPKPPRVDVHTDNIPHELTTQKRWVVWRYAWRSDKWTKPPYQARNPKAKAMSNNPETWATFNHAVTAYKEHADLDGIGYALAADGEFVGIDLDHMIDPSDGTLTPAAARTVQQLNTYTEISPSGEGLRLIACGSLNGLTGRKSGDFEVYDSGRYVTITGCILGDTRPIRNAQPELEAWHAEYIAPPKRETVPAAQVGPKETPNETDQELLERAFQSRNGSAVRELWDGSTTAHGGDHSAADLALAGSLSWWTNYDLARTDLMFRQSQLMRAKWDEVHFSDGRTYGQGTLDKAFDGKAPGMGHTEAPERRRISHPGGDSNNQTYGRNDSITVTELEPAPDPVVTSDALYIRERFLEELDERHARPDPNYSTGLHLLDQLLGGGYIEGFHVLGGITGGGKTSLAVHIATHNALEGRAVLYATFEQSRLEMWARVASRLTSIPYTAIKRGTFQQKGYGATIPASEALQTSAGWPKVLDVSKHLRVIEAGDALSRSMFDLDELARVAEVLAVERGSPPLVICDYLQRIPGPPEIRDIRERVGYVAGMLQVKLARGLGCPVLALSSLSRAGYGLSEKSNPGERLAAFKEAGEIEYSAYTATMLYGLPEAKRGSEMHPGLMGSFRPMVIDVAKNREGRTDRFAVKWQPKGDQWSGVMEYGGDKEAL